MSSYKKLNNTKGFTLPELMLTVALVGIFLVVGSTILLNVVRYWRVNLARSRVQQNSRAVLDLINRNLRQATASSVVISEIPNQPPYSWITFSIDKGTGAALGNYGFYQQGNNMMFMHNGSTSTLADDLQYVAFTYPETDNSGILSVSVTFQDQTYYAQNKALQQSIAKVRIMN